MRFFASALALTFTACWAQTLNVPSTERFTYDIEWRLIHAGTTVVDVQKNNARVKLESAGLVSTLYKIDDSYGVTYDEPFCATSTTLDSQEGKRHHETRVVYDRTKNQAHFIEKDMLKNSVMHASDLAVPNCVHDVLGALMSMRGLTLNPGQSTQVAMSDGRRVASVKVDAQDREEIKSGTKTYKTIRCETFLLNGVVYTRKGRVLVWLTDDARKMPVQIQLRMSFPVGTVTLHLIKEEKL